MTQNFGRELIFSADLCYNRVNAKPPSEREGDRVSGGRSLRDLKVRLLHCSALSLSRLRRQLPPGGSLWMRSFFFRGMGISPVPAPFATLYYKCETGDKTERYIRIFREDSNSELLVNAGNP